MFESITMNVKGPKRTVVLDNKLIIEGPNGSGKSAIVEALSIVLTGTVYGLSFVRDKAYKQASYMRPICSEEVLRIELKASHGEASYVLPPKGSALKNSDFDDYEFLIPELAEMMTMNTEKQLLWWADRLKLPGGALLLVPGFTQPVSDYPKAIAYANKELKRLKAELPTIQQPSQLESKESLALLEEMLDTSKKVLRAKSKLKREREKDEPNQDELARLGAALTLFEMKPHGDPNHCRASLQRAYKDYALMQAAAELESKAAMLESKVTIFKRAKTLLIMALGNHLEMSFGAHLRAELIPLSNGRMSLSFGIKGVTILWEGYPVPSSGEEQAALLILGAAIGTRRTILVAKDRGWDPSFLAGVLLCIAGVKPTVIITTTTRIGNEQIAPPSSEGWEIVSFYTGAGVTEVVDDDELEEISC